MAKKRFGIRIWYNSGKNKPKWYHTFQERDAQYEKYKAQALRGGTKPSQVFRVKKIEDHS